MLAKICQARQMHVAFVEENGWLFIPSKKDKEPSLEPLLK